MAEKIRVTTFVKNLLGGGAERVAVNVMQGLPQAEFEQELVLVSGWGPFMAQIPAHVKVTDLDLKGGAKNQGNTSKSLLPLAAYLRKNKPDVLLAHLAHANMAAVLAAKLAGVGTKVIIVEHNDNRIVEQRTKRSLPNRAMQLAKSQIFRRANRIVGVSDGVSEYVRDTFGVPKDKVVTVYNPVISQELLRKAEEPLDHPWFANGQAPVLVASGRLRDQKDFITLLRAVDIVRRSRPVKLLIMGEGQERPKLEAEIARLNLQDIVSLPGFVENPYKHMKHADLFVLSSRWEGLPTVLLEAMACGCPVVATDCPSGPDEILEGGKHGPLVPMADPEALATAILEALSHPVDTAQLKARAMHFSFENSIANYGNLLQQVAEK